MTQLEQEGSSLALTRLLVMTAKRQYSLRQPSIRSHAHSITHSSGHVSAVHQLTVRLQPEQLIQPWRYKVVATPSTYILTHRSDFESCTPATLHRYTGAQYDSESESLRLAIWLY